MVSLLKLAEITEVRTFTTCLYVVIFDQVGGPETVVILAEWDDSKCLKFMVKSVQSL